MCSEASKSAKIASGSRKPRNSGPDSAGKMGYDLDFKKSSKLQHSFKTMKETVLPKQVKETVSHHDQLKGKSCSDMPHRGPPRELRQSTSSGKHQQESIGAKTTRDDELVKYMSNLPGYLQRLDRGDNIQEKAFNVGVLDWSRLERWKGNQKCTAASDGNNFAATTSGNLSSKMSSRSSTLSKEVHKEDLSYQRRLHPSVCSGKNLSHNDADSLGAKPSTENVLQFQDPGTSSRSKSYGDKMVSTPNKSFSKNDRIKILGKGKGKGQGLDQSTSSTRAHQLSNSRYEGIPVKPKDYRSVCDSETGKRDDAKSKALNQKVTSSAGALSSKLNVPSSLRENKNVGDGETIKTREFSQDPSIGHTYEHQPVDGRNIVLLFPRNLSKVSSSENKPRTSLHRNSKEPEQNSFSGSFCNAKVPSSGHCSEIPHSCPLPSRKETNLEPCNKEHTAFSMQSADQSYDASHTSACMPKMPTSLSASEVWKNSVMSTKEKGTYKILDQETAELATRKGRHPSPNRRFSFSLSRMTKSFSFKENSSVPQLSSTYVSAKSGPVTSRACCDDSNKEKASLCNRSRASPLRRILDPLLKSRGSSTLDSSQTDRPMKGNWDYLGMAPFVTIHSLHNEKYEKSLIQAHLQLMSKNGLPLFRLVVDNNSCILAATKMTVGSPLKSDSTCYYTIYAIEEMKKRSGSWINQAGKEKSCDYVYNMIAQMKINSSSSFDSSEWYPTNQYNAKESVLFGAEPRQADQVSPKFMPGRELAAIIARMSNRTQRLDQPHNLMEKGLSQCLSSNRWHCDLEGDNHSNSTTVILPGGVHSLPEKGGPSPLIQRWKSGGSCDCGGWDIGCNLRILSNESGHFQSPKTSNSYPTSDSFELFLQGEAQKEEPVFSLTLLEKGLYSIKFSPSISLLEAFFICITVISCQTSSDLAEECNLSEQKVHQEFSTANERDEKFHIVVPGQATAKYAPSPPFSPVGRV